MKRMDPRDLARIATRSAFWSRPCTSTSSFSGRPSTPSPVRRTSKIDFDMRSLILIASLACAAGLMAQDTSNKKPVPRTADGHPDLSGVWQGGGASGLAFAIGSENAKAARPDDPAVAKAPAAVVPARMKPPYQDWILPKVEEIRNRRNIDDPSSRCLLVGVPRITNEPLPIKIIQTKDEIAFLYETFHAFRIIPTDGRKHP